MHSEKEIYKYYHFLFCQLKMQRNQHLPCAIVRLLILPFFHHKPTYFHLDKFKYRQIQICGTSKLYSSYRKILKFQTRLCHYTTHDKLTLKQIICNEHYPSNVISLYVWLELEPRTSITLKKQKTKSGYWRNSCW